MKTLTEEDLLKIFVTTEPSARSPYGLYGYPPMWEVLKLSDNLTLFARPCRTMARLYPEDPYREVDGVQYQFRLGDRWLDQGVSVTYKRFLDTYQERCAGFLERYGPKRLTDNQQYVISTLNYRGACFTARCFEEAWKKGETYYIDSRNGARRGLQRAIDKGNKEALT